MNRKNLIGLCISFICVIAVVFMWQGSMNKTKTNEKSDYPILAYNVEEGSTNDAFSNNPTGGSFVLGETGETRESDFLISFEEDSKTVKFNSNILMIDSDTVKIPFEVRFSEALSGIQVLRWSVSDFGTQYPLDNAERVIYTDEKKGYSFIAEAGYVYSVYTTWGESFAEYPIQVLKNK